MDAVDPGAREVPEVSEVPGASEVSEVPGAHEAPEVSGASTHATAVPLDPEDVAEVADLWQACGLTRPWNPPEDDFLRALHGPASQVLGIRGAQGRVLATVMVGHDGHRGWLYYLAVDPQHRGAGLGRSLVGAAESWLQERGIPKVMLMVRETNTRVLAYYEAQGFSRSSSVVMERWLDEGATPPGAGPSDVTAGSETHRS